jgi:hypothetical protein
VPKHNDISSLLKISSLYQSKDSEFYKEVTRSRIVVTGYEETAGLAYKYISVSLVPLANSIGPERAYVAVLASRRSIFLFYRFVSFEYSGWSNVRIKTSTDWQVEEAPLKDDTQIDHAVKRIMTNMQSQIIERLEAAFPPPDDSLPAPQEDRGQTDDLTAEEN